MRSPVATRARSAKAAAENPRASHHGAPSEAACPPLPAHGPPAERASGTAGASIKRPRETQLDVEDFSCSVCLSLLVDPVVGSCGHDFCELCFQRWTVDQGKNSCPACRKALAPELPGICHRLQRTIQALFPERLEERQAEVAEERRALAAEKRARDEARRQEAVQHEAAGGHTQHLLQAVLESLFNEPIFRRQPTGGRAAAPQQAQQGQQGQQGQAHAQAQAARSAQRAWHQSSAVAAMLQAQPAGQQEQAQLQAARSFLGTFPQTLQQQAGRLVQRRYPTRQAAAATAGGGPPGQPPPPGLAFPQADVPPAFAPPAHVQQPQQPQQQQQQLSLAQGLQNILASLLPGGQRQQPAGPAAAAAAAHALQQQRHPHARVVQQPQQQQQHAQHSFELQVVHFSATPSQLHAAQMGNVPFHVVPLTLGPAAAGGAAASALRMPGLEAGAGWPLAPPLTEMQFQMGWHDPNDGRRRRQSRSGV